MPLYSSEIARREQEELLIRPEPVRLTWSFEDLVTGDGHVLRCRFTCSVRALERPAERRMLEEVFLGRSAVLTSDGVLSHFHGALRAAAATASQKRPASEWLEGDRRELVDALKTAGNRVAFSCGLELLAPFQADLESPTLEQQRLEAAQRTMAEQRAVGQVEHFQRATELLKQFESMRQAGSQLSPGEVLKQISPADQGMALQALLMAGAKGRATEAGWAVGGATLVRIDPKAGAIKGVAIDLPTELGPLRSVQPSNGGLLVGARSGVMELISVGDGPHPFDVTCYADSAVTSQKGFSRVVRWHGEMWACHGEGGIVSWKAGEADRPACAIRPADLGAATPRNLQVLDDCRLVFSSQDRVMVLSLRSEGQTASAIAAGPSAGAEIVAILPDREGVTVVLQDGRVQSRHPDSLAVAREFRPCGPISAAALLPWLGSSRLLLATEDGPVVCVGWDDDLVTQYLSPYRALRVLAAAADLILGISADRQRIVLWQSWSPRQPMGELFVPLVARHGAADVDVG